MIIAVLTGRKGSKGFPNKNLYNVMGYPLAYYPMKAALNTPEIDDIYMSTDDEELKALARKYNIDVINRPLELCSDSAVSSDVFIHAYKLLKKQYNIEFLVLFMCNAPTITSKMLSEGIKILRENPNLDSAVSVSKYNMYNPARARKIVNNTLQSYIPFQFISGKINSDRNAQDDCWFADMGVSIVRSRCLENIKDGMLPQTWMGQKIYPLKQEAGLDVDYEWQIGQVDYWLKRWYDD